MEGLGLFLQQSSNRAGESPRKSFIVPDLDKVSEFDGSLPECKFSSFSDQGLNKFEDVNIDICSERDDKPVQKPKLVRFATTLTESVSLDVDMSEGQATDHANMTPYFPPIADVDDRKMKNKNQVNEQ